MHSIHQRISQDFVFTMTKSFQVLLQMFKFEHQIPNDLQCAAELSLVFWLATGRPNLLLADFHCFSLLEN